MNQMVQERGKRTAAASATTSAPIEAVWNLIATTESWPTWASKMDRAERVRDGRNSPEGLGAQRSFHAGRVNSIEDVVEFDAPHRFAYSLVSGLPLKDYVGRITLTEVDGGTRIDWRSSFNPKFPGSGLIWQWGIRRLLRDLSTDLAKGAERAV